MWAGSICWTLDARATFKDWSVLVESAHPPSGISHAMILILEISLGVLLGWLLIQAVQQLLKMPQKQLDRAKADTESAVENVLRKLDKERVEQELRDMSRELNHLHGTSNTRLSYISRKNGFGEKPVRRPPKPESDVTGTGTRTPSDRAFELLLSCSSRTKVMITLVEAGE